MAGVDGQRKDGAAHASRSERVLEGVSRFMVWLMWAVLLAVVVVVVYLAERFYG